MMGREGSNRTYRAIGVPEAHHGLTHHDLPILLAGGAAASIKPGRHVRYKSETPLNNLFLALLDRMGVRTEKLGDSDGVLDHLGELS